MGCCGFVYERSLESLVFLVFEAEGRGINASLISDAGEDSSDAEGCEYGVCGRERGDLFRIAWIGSLQRSPIMA